jgi:2TM domain
MMTEAQKTALARRKVEMLTGFYVHFAVYVVVMAGLVAINYASGTDWWAHWAAVGWGIGLALHAVIIYGGLDDRITNWQLRKIYRLKNQM